VFLPTAESKPWVPTNENKVLETLPKQQLRESFECNQLRQQLTHSPTSVSTAAHLASCYTKIARSDSDPRYYGYAQACLNPWWDSKAPPLEILLLRATIRQHFHEYDAAVADLKQFLSTRPSDSQAWMTLATIQQVRGKYDEARISCTALAGNSSICHAQIMALTGKAERAYSLLKLQTQRLQKKIRLIQWLLTLMGETAQRLGLTEQAKKHFTKAIAHADRDPYLLRVYSDFLLEQNQPEKVLALLKDESRDDALLLRLAIAAQHAGNSNNEYKQELLDRYRAAQLRGSDLHERDEARFLLELENRPAEALRLARKNWTLQKEPEDARLLMQTAQAANDTESIQIVLEWINKHGLQDVRINAFINKISSIRYR